MIWRPPGTSAVTPPSDWEAGGDGKRLLAALFSGVLLGIPWVFHGFSFVIFIAWLPLFHLENRLRRQHNPYLLFNYALLGFFIWNLLGTWWVARAHFPGAVLIMLANAMLQAFCFWLAGRLGKILALPLALPFTLVWMGYEHFHEWWDLSWPWLNLGNALASSPAVIQWYEYTGARGGSLWIILANIAAYGLYRAICGRGSVSRVRAGALFLLVLAAPALFSWQLYRTVDTGTDTLAFALVQPNLDPYTQKFIPEKHAVHLDTFFKTADALCDGDTRLLVGPETLFLDLMDERDPASSANYQRLQAFQGKYPLMNLLLGTHSLQKLPRGQAVPGSRYDAGKDLHFEAFNAALFLAPAAGAQFYHKTKLVPLFERMPFVQYLGFLGNISLELGGYHGTYSNRQARPVFQTPDRDLNILPIVCFESVFGPYNATRLPAGKGLIVMITNDGWWKNTPGYQHHFNFSRMRAIESRRTLIRAANNGISALIDARGCVVARTPWWQAATLKGEARLLAGRTLFSRLGDYLGRTGLIGAVGLGLFAFVSRRRR